MEERSAGVLLHPSSLPGAYGVGTLGTAARDFIDFLADGELMFWQVLPLGPTGFGDSPYSSFSSFAGNPLLIDLQPLIDAGLLDYQDVEPLSQLPSSHVDFGKLQQQKLPLLRLAFRRFREKKLAYIPNYGRFQEFCQVEEIWLRPFSRYMALKSHFGGASWPEWPAPWNDGSGSGSMPLPPECELEAESHQFFQYLFFAQWKQIRDHAHSRGVEIIGDIPIYVAMDSADTWASREWFQLDPDGAPIAVAGVPPDYFSETGQLWGNPLYDWDALERADFRWWIERLRSNFRMFDVIRLDHFRGFYDYWAVPAGAEDARGGKWIDGPRDAFFTAVQKEFGPEARIIAEDLGELSEGVHSFLDQLGLPGMCVLEFAFDGEDSRNLFLPHNQVPNRVIYTGTHDNDTVIGWYESQPERVRDQVRRYFRISGEDISWDLIRAAYRSVARLAIFQMQDLLSLGGDARMNFPGVPQGNWQWRMTREQFEWQRGSTPYLRELAWLYGR